MEARVVLLPVVMLVVATAACLGQEGEVIYGGSSIELSGPVSDEIATKVKAEAYENLRQEILGWLEVNLLAEWNINNGIDRTHLETFVRTVANKARQESKFSGRNKWLFSYRVPAEGVMKLAEEWNTRHDALAVQAYVQLSSAAEHRSIAETYAFGIRTIYHARAHVGQRTSRPGKTGKDYVYETRQILRDVLEKLEISIATPILAGKPGFHPEQALEVKVTVDKVPFPGFQMEVGLAGGKRLGVIATDAEGIALIDDVVIPYVPNGTFFNIVPNAGAMIDRLFFFTIRDLDLHLTRTIDQQLMLKIIRPTFVLEYKPAAVSDFVLPRDFSKADFLEAFLHDSCYMQKAVWGTAPDVRMKVECQVSSYTHERTEQHVRKAEIRVMVKEETSPRKSEAKNLELFQKSYKMGVEVPEGLFFWETTKVLYNTIKKSLQDL